MRASKRYDDDGTAVYTVRLAPEQAAVLDAALEQVRTELDRSSPDVSAETPPRRASLADALLTVAQRVLDGAEPDVARRSRAALTVQVDPLSGWARLRDGEVLPPCSPERVLGTLPGRERPDVRPLTDADLRRHDSGRTRRRPTQQLRDLLGTLDGERCRYPGCTRHRRLHAHHVERWSDGGRTDLDNLVLLCPRHHTLVHAQGTSLRLHPDRRLEVSTADGVAVPHLPSQPWGPSEGLPDVSAETVPTPSADRLDLGYAVSVLVRQAA